jgi:hypothetical protein
MQTKDQTRNQWFEEFRKVKKGEKPSGFLNVTVPRYTDHEEIGTDGSHQKWTTVEQATLRIPTYTKAQTVKYKRACYSVLRSMFHGYFVGCRKNYIWKTPEGWKTCKRGYLDNAKIKAHIEGKENYGVRAGDLTNCIVADMDLHKGNKQVFIRQLEAVMAYFHGKLRVHYSISKGGVHVIIMFNDPLPIETARAWLRKQLEAIDTEELKQFALQHNMRPISQMEIKPSRKDGWRLPFAAGRVTYTDQPLVGNDKKTFEKYIGWLHKPTYAPMEPIFNFICDHVEETNDEDKPKKKVSVAKKKPVPQTDVVFGSLGKQKGCYRATLVDFWTGKTTPADTLNTAIVLTARMLPYYSSEDEAIDYLEELVDDVPDNGFSDRLSSGNRAEVSRVIRSTVSKVYGGNGGQPDVEQSNEKLIATKKAWDRIGFNLLDKTTWGKASSTLGEYFNFSPQQVKSLSYLADILKTDLTTCAELTRQVLRIVHTQRELSVTYFQKVIKSFGISSRHDGRVNEFINALCNLGWMIRLKNYVIGRARTFIAGDEFYGQVSSSTIHSHSHESSLSVPLNRLERELEELLGFTEPAAPMQEQEKPPPLPVAEVSVGS